MKFRTFWTRVAACASLALAATSAQAELLNFTLTGDYTASWQLDSTVGPDAFAPDEGIAYFDVAGFPDAVLGLADLTFYNTALGGGLEILDYYGDTLLLQTDGAQLYAGPESSPVFLTGSFALTEFQGTGRYTLNVAVAAVPEPASLALMLAGLLVVGAVASRRGRQNRE